jgi:hypothetical protein
MSLAFYPSNNEPVVIDQALKALAEAETLGEIKAIRDKAEAVRKYAASASLGLDAQNYAAEVKLRAERKAGILLGELRLRGGDRKSNGCDDRLKLEDLGITHSQSTRWQLQAKLPLDDFEEYIRETRDAGREIVTSAVLSRARRFSLLRKARKENKGSAEPEWFDSEHNGFCELGHSDCHKLSFDNGLVELAHHRDLLNTLLEPLYTGKQTELLPAQLRVLGHILREMRDLILELQQFARRFVGDNGVNGSPVVFNLKQAPANSITMVPK